MFSKKSLFIAAVATSLFATSCLKNDTTPTTTTPTYQNPQLEISSIDKFTDSMGFYSMQYDPNLTGFKYEILELGDTTYKVSSTNPIAVVKYKGTLLNGFAFDSTYKNADSTTKLDIYNGFYNNNLIYCWGYTFLNRNIPAKIGKGGHIRFVSASAYGYGATAQSIIPANSPLFFDIYLKDVVAY